MMTDHDNRPDSHISASKKMNFADVVRQIREEAQSEFDKGHRFEKLVKRWLQADPRYSHLSHVWLWSEFPGKDSLGGKDLGIDLVACTDLGEFWAIQCKFYAEETVVDKAAVDSFISNSSRQFQNPFSGEHTDFSVRVWVSITENWSKNAEEATKNLSTPFIRINEANFSASEIDWAALLMYALTGSVAKPGFLDFLSRPRVSIQAPAFRLGSGS